ncbi:MAG: hypothetical protein OQK12_09640, partial [Motiliproteus sp.]|nr:hypothetical protein [Motiliproteus sp.]
MYNSNIPSHSDLPSTKQLLVSTLAAGVFAAMVLVTAILPAEYGIDPTGIGQTLGLTQMGEIKASLADEARHAKEKEIASKPLPSSQPSQQVQAAETTSKTDAANATPLKQDQRQITLAPGAAAEVKMAMRKGA